MAPKDRLRTHRELVQLDLSLSPSCVQGADRSPELSGNPEMGYAARPGCHVHQASLFRRPKHSGIAPDAAGVQWVEKGMSELFSEQILMGK